MSDRRVISGLSEVIDIIDSCIIVYDGTHKESMEPKASKSLLQRLSYLSRALETCRDHVEPRKMPFPLNVSEALTITLYHCKEEAKRLQSTLKRVNTQGPVWPKTHLWKVISRRSESETVEDSMKSITKDVQHVVRSVEVDSTQPEQMVTILAELQRWEAPSPEPSIDTRDDVIDTPSNLDSIEAEEAVRLKNFNPLSSASSNLILFVEDMQKNKTPEEEMIDTLLTSKYAKDNFTDNRGWTLLSWAAMCGQLELVNFLLRSGRFATYHEDDQGRSPLSRAAEKGHERVVQAILSKDPSGANNVDHRRTTPLSWAAGEGFDGVVRLLLAEQIIGPNLADSIGRTPLTWAVIHGHRTTAQILLDDARVGVNIADQNGHPPLFWAIKKGNAEMVEILLQARDIDVNIYDKHGATPLLFAAQNGWTECVCLLLESSNIKPDCRSHAGNTPLILATKNGHEQITRLLLDTYQVRPDLQDLHGRTPLSWAAQHGHEQVARLLLDTYQVRPDPVDLDGRTPLSWAAQHGHEQVARLLLDTHQVLPDSVDLDGRTPLSWAAECGHKELVQFLLHIDQVKPDLKDQTGRTPLSWAVQHGHEYIAELLLETGKVELDSEDDQGRTPILWAAEAGLILGVKYLLEKHQPNVRKQDRSGWTPLLWAAHYLEETLVKLLLEQNVDVNSKDGNGRTPLSLVAEKGHESIARQLLQTSGVDVNSKDKIGRTPLSWAAQHRHDGVVRLLLDSSQVEPNQRDRTGRTPLSWAVNEKSKPGTEMERQTSVVVLLLETNRVEHDLQDHTGRTPLSYAAENGNHFAVRALLNEGPVDPHLPDVQGVAPIHRGRYPDVKEEFRLNKGKGQGFKQLQDFLNAVESDGHRTLRIEARWEVPQSLLQYRDKVRFSSILTVSGGEIDAQAMTCASYLKQHFSIGTMILECLEAAWISEPKRFACAKNGLNLSVEIPYTSCEDLHVVAEGRACDVQETAIAIAWFSCALRPATDEQIDLSTFTFSRNTECMKLRLVPLRKIQQHSYSCWHRLFTKAIIVQDAPISDRTALLRTHSEKSGLRIPRGLEISFETMVDLAAVDYPFEHERGLVLKGVRTVLVAAGTWTLKDGLAVQWHFSDTDIRLSRYTDDDAYHIWQENEPPNAKFEYVKQARRTFLGWSQECYIELCRNLQLGQVNATTNLHDAGPEFTLRSIGTSFTFGKSPFTASVSATYEVQKGARRYPREKTFTEMVELSIKAPVLLYAADEHKGWLIPQIWLLVAMIRIHVQENQLEPPPPDIGVDIESARQKLLNNHDFKFLSQRTDTEKTEALAVTLKDLFCQKAQTLEWAEENARKYPIRRSKDKLYGLELFRFAQDKLYGLELFRLALGTADHSVKVCPIKDTHGAWIQLFKKNIIHGVVFCRGISEAISFGPSRCELCKTLPEQRSYLAAMVNCLNELKRYGRLPPNKTWEFDDSTFAACYECSSCQYRLQMMKFSKEPASSSGPASSNGPVSSNEPSLTNGPVSSTVYDNRIVVYGKREKAS